MASLVENTIVSGFKGINNRIDPSALGANWQLSADNCLCDLALYIVRRPGYSEFATGIVDIYGTVDGRLLVINDNNDLIEYYSDGSSKILASDFYGAPFRWAEFGYIVLAQTDDNIWAIYPDRVVKLGIPVLPAPTLVKTTGSLKNGTYQVACVLISQDGRIGGCATTSITRLDDNEGIIISSDPVAGYSTLAYMSSADGVVLDRAGILVSGSITISELPKGGSPLSTLHLYPPPNSQFIASHGNRVCVAVWEGEYDRTTLYWSRPDTLHLFAIEKDYQFVSGRPVLLASVASGLLVGTDKLIYIVPPDSTPTIVARYGARSNEAITVDSGQILFWTDRGLCSYPPFKNITDAHLIPENKEFVSSGKLLYNGTQYYICCQYGIDYMKFKEPSYTPLNYSLL